MNIIFWFLVIVTLILVWFVLSFCFKGLGKFLIDLFYDAKAGISDENNKTEEEQNQ